ncbi:MAG: peptide deformylase [Methyloprofundus sp.]|nr:peptide deformylase [Methyloprofundus sp.]
MSKREIAQLGNEALRQTAKLVDDLDSSEIQQVITDLLCTLQGTSGVGIAAPQISESWQIMVLASKPTTRYPDAPDMAETVMINPSFSILSDEIEKDWEGCLSIPSIRAKVPRYKQIKISYTNLQGGRKRTELNGFVARVFQHEYDHLQGLVYLDRVESNRDIFSEAEYLQQIQVS